MSTRDRDLIDVGLWPALVKNSSVGQPARPVSVACVQSWKPQYFTELISKSINCLFLEWLSKNCGYDLIFHKKLK